ncbi:MAG: hypothetical protein ACRDZY_10060 [Acidimicrobiales bacterium]
MSTWWWAALGVAATGTAALAAAVGAAGREVDRLRRATVEVRRLRGEVADRPR